MAINLKHLGILVTTYCNLNCRHCADLIPHRQNYHYPLSEIKSDLLKVLNAVDSVEEILIIGGETLMYPYIYEVLDFCRNQAKIKKIIFITNGKALPNKNLLDCLEKNNIVVRVSGYSDYVTPNRNESIELFKERGLIIEDIKNMNWAEIGDNSDKKRTPDELTKIFSSCAMRDCISLVRGGYIIFCSRQCAAFDTDLYPFPQRHEYVDVRLSNNLATEIKDFLELPYISTCNYCNGISHLTTKVIPSGIQILPKSVMLELIDYYYRWTKEGDFSSFTMFTKILLDNNENLSDIDEYPVFLENVRTGMNSEDENKLVIASAAMLLNRLLDDYDFINSNSIPYYKRTPFYLTLNPKDKETLSPDAHYRIFNNDGLGQVSLKNAFSTEILGGPNTNADLYITDDDLLEAVNEIYPIAGVNYSRLFLESKLQKISEGGIKCAICGLSYTQEGVIESQMPVESVNLSTGGQDVQYSLLMSKKAISLSSDIETVIIPIAYFQGFYDITSDNHPVHEATVTYVDVPLLGDKRNFNKSLPDDLYFKNTGVLDIYERISDLKELRKKRDQELLTIFKNLDFYNDFNPRNPIGGLKYDFHKLNSEEKMEKAIITEQLNRRILSYTSLEDVLKSMEIWAEFVEEKSIRTIFFVPPFTHALSVAGEKCGKTKQIFYNTVVPEIKKIPNVEFIDMCTHPDFNDDDFADFEHLNYNGAVKLTRILGELMSR